MPHLFSDIPDKLRLVLSQAANLFLVIVMIYIFQYIFNSQFSCSCTPQLHVIVFIYIGLIPVILFFILKLMKQTRTRFCGGCFCGLCPELIQLAGICIFWCGFVLLDGDLYVCMVTKHNATLVEIPCKKNRSLHEDSIITIYKNWSQLYGYICIAVGFIGWWLLSSTTLGLYCGNCSFKCLKDCCSKICEIRLTCECLKNCICKLWKGKLYFEMRYEELLSEQTDEYLDKKLQNIAKKRAEKICFGDIGRIENSQFTQDPTIEISEEERDAWSNISRPGFYKSDILEDVNNGEHVSNDILFRIQ